MQKRIELKRRVDLYHELDPFELCRQWQCNPSNDETLQDLAAAQRTKTRFRGQVLLSSHPPGHPERTCKPSVCSINETHFTLLGGDEWEVELVKLDNFDLEIATYDNTCFSLKMNTLRPGSLDFVENVNSKTPGTRTDFVSVTNQEARDRWLSVLLEKGVVIAGWDASSFCQPSSSFTRAASAPGLKRTPSLVTWLS